MAQPISDDEYQSMFTPQGALAQLLAVGLEPPAAKAEIKRRLISGALRSIAHRAFVDSPVGELAYDRMRIARSAWADGDVPEAFWMAGDLDLPHNRELGAALTAFVDGPMKCLGVRFDRQDINLIVDDHRQAAALGTPSAIGSIVEAGAKQAIMDIKPNGDIAEDFLKRTAPALFDTLGIPSKTRQQLDLEEAHAPGRAKARRLQEELDLAMGRQPSPGTRPVVADFDEDEFGELTRRLARRRGEGPYDPMSPVMSRKQAVARFSERKVKAPQKPAKGPVRPAEFDAWYGGLSPADQARPHRWLTDEAKKYFQGRRGLKAFIDAKTMGRPLGRRRKAS